MSEGYTAIVLQWILYNIEEARQLKMEVVVQYPYQVVAMIATP
jgi:hypothetical protein